NPKLASVSDPRQIRCRNNWLHLFLSQETILAAATARTHLSNSDIAPRNPIHIPPQIHSVSEIRCNQHAHPSSLDGRVCPRAPRFANLSACAVSARGTNIPASTPYPECPRP